MMFKNHLTRISNDRNLEKSAEVEKELVNEIERNLKTDSEERNNLEVNSEVEVEVEAKIDEADLNDFDNGDSNASKTIPINVKNVKKGSTILMNGKNACKVIDIFFHKDSKHGHSKATITGVDIFTGRKFQEVCQGHCNKEEIVISREEYYFIELDSENNLTLMDKKGNLSVGISLKEENEDEEEIIKKIRKLQEENSVIIVSVIKALDNEKVESVKESTD